MLIPLKKDLAVITQSDIKVIENNLNNPTYLNILFNNSNDILQKMLIKKICELQDINIFENDLIA